MSIAMEFHTWVNAQSFVPGVINFNIARPLSVDPWFVMSVAASSNDFFTLCSDGGEQTIEIRGYGSERYDTYEVLEQLRDDIVSSLRGALPSYNVWRVLSTGTVALGSVEEQMNEYSMEIVISWEQMI